MDLSDLTAAILKIIFIRILFELRILKSKGDHADLDRSRIIFHSLPISSFFCLIQEQLRKMPRLIRFIVRETVTNFELSSERQIETNLFR